MSSNASIALGPTGFKSGKIHSKTGGEDQTELNTSLGVEYPEDDQTTTNSKKNQTTGPETCGFLFGYSVIAKSMMGSGIIGLAFACSKMGWFLGIFLLVFSGLCTVFSLNLLAELCIKKLVKNQKVEDDSVTLFTLCRAICPKMTFFVDVIVVIKALLGSMGYLILSGEMIATTIYPDVLNPESNQLVRAGPYPLARKITQILILLVLSPLFFSKKLTKTNVPNMIGIVCWVFVAVVAVAFSEPLLLNEKVEENQRGETSGSPSGFTSVISRLSLFIFAYGCQQNLFSVISETKNPKKRESVNYFTKISIVASFSGFLIFLPVLIFPYLTFGDKIKPNFLTNISEVSGQNWWVSTAKICAALSVCLSLPLQIHPLRSSLFTLYYSFKKSDETEKTSNELRLRVFFTTFSLVLILLVALFVEELGLILSISGVIGSNTTSFFIPSLLYVQEFQNNPAKRGPKYVMAALMLFFSSVFYPVCLSCIIYEYSR